MPQTDKSHKKKYSGIRRAEVAKAGKRSGPYQRPPKPTRSVSERDARYLRKGRLDGAFGAAPVHVWNHLIKGTSGRHKLNSKELSVLAKQIRATQMADLYEKEDV